MQNIEIKQQLKKLLLEISDNEDFLLGVLSNIRTEKYRTKMIDFITIAKRRNENINRENIVLLSVVLGNEEDKEYGRVWIGGNV